MFLYEEGDWERRLRGWCRGREGEADLRFMAAGGGWMAGWLGFGLGFGVPSLWEKRGDVFQRRSLFYLGEVICFGCMQYISRSAVAISTRC
jgi:hypothetical protein